MDFAVFFLFFVSIFPHSAHIQRLLDDRRANFARLFLLRFSPSAELWAHTPAWWRIYERFFKLNEKASRKCIFWNELWWRSWTEYEFIMIDTSVARRCHEAAVAAVFRCVANWSRKSVGKSWAMRNIILSVIEILSAHTANVWGGSTHIIMHGAVASFLAFTIRTQYDFHSVLNPKKLSIYREKSSWNDFIWMLSLPCWNEQRTMAQDNHLEFMRRCFCSHLSCFRKYLKVNWNCNRNFKLLSLAYN